MCWGALELFFTSLLFPDKAEDCGAVREAFIPLLPHCRGGRGGDGVFLFDRLRQAHVMVCCIYVSLTTFVTVFMLFLLFFGFLLLDQKPRNGRSKIRCGVEV